MQYKLSLVLQLQLKKPLFEQLYQTFQILVLALAISTLVTKNSKENIITLD